MITVTLVASALAFAQAGASGLPQTTLPDPIGVEDVAYEALADGRAAEAIARIEALLAEQPDDPALLINLAAAYWQQGDYEMAAQAYRRAAETAERYDLELADGRWMDSRSVARQALARLESTQLATR